MSAVERLAEALPEVNNGGKPRTNEQAAQRILAADPALADAVELGLAYAEVETLLPEGVSLTVWPRMWFRDGSGFAMAEVRIPRTTFGRRGPRWNTVRVEAATLTEALRNLATKLREPVPA